MTCILGWFAILVSLSREKGYGSWEIVMNIYGSEFKNKYNDESKIRTKRKMIKKREGEQI